MINRALVCAILIAAGIVAALNSKAPAETAAELQVAVGPSRQARSLANTQELSCKRRLRPERVMLIRTH